MSEQHDDSDAKSKSQLKRESEALVSLGEALVRLPAATLAHVPLDEALRDAVAQARRLAKGAYQRQLRYIGRLLREGDAAPVREALARLDDAARREARHFHEIERWRDRLIEEGDAALGPLLAEHAQADRQHLRRLVREARRERDEGRPLGAGRALFRHLRELLDG